jgi:UDP-N-acetylglucosamine diphosphorylase / glucose-1-phosphate thymidylyltransferase / UDP-N-acetylgalactosamine diphosphorylase / glucosamine-1-phosphate N-acetyltransferase / galactosamine-1-phosphate N-acetyltransferase
MTNRFFSPEYYFDLEHVPFPELFEGVEYVWEAIPRIARVLEERLSPGIHETAVVSPGAFVGERVQIGPGTVVEHGASIPGPAILGAGCQVRSGAYIRSHVIAGDGAILGYCCEFKNCLLHAGAEVYHFAYVGDSLLGHKAHLGAGVKISNVKLTCETIKVRGPEETLDTGLIKFGAVLGDRTDIGCNCVLNPGSLIGPRSLVYPGSSWQGFLPAGHIAKLRQTFEVVERRE